MNALEKLRSVVDELKANSRPTETQPNWDLAGRLASRFPVDTARLTQAMKTKDLAELDAIVAEIEKPPEPKKAADAGGPGVDHDTQLAAMRAFKKRLKLLRLDDESRLGAKQMTGGRKSEIDAIEPPRDFGPEVWASLVRAGKLRDTGQGFYQLVEG